MAIPQNFHENNEMVRISFERRLDMEKMQQMYEKNREFLHFEHVQNSLVVTLKIPPKLAEILSFLNGGNKTSVGCDQMSKLYIGSKQFSYTANYSVGGRYGDVRIRFNDRPPDIDEHEFFDAIYESLNPHMKIRAFKYLCMALPNPPTPDNYPSPIDVKEFNVDYCQQILIKREKIPSILHFRECEMTIDIPHAIYLVECFATNQSKKERGMSDKDFLTEKKIYTLMIFAELPVAFSQNGRKAILTFANYCGISAQAIRNQVSFVMNIFKNCKQMLCQFTEVLNYNFKQAHVIDAENDVGVAIVKDMDQPTFPLKNRNFMLYGLSSEPGTGQFKLYESVLREAWNKICIYTCPVCLKLNTSRNPCPLGEHVGDHIPFEDGDLEKNVVIGGVATVQRNYTCCGVVNVAFDLGCSTESNHTFPNEERYFTSGLHFRYI
jgi:hypothetical protein